MRSTVAVVLMLVTASLASGQVTLPGAYHGSDGDFAPTEDVAIRLDLAPTSAWDAPNPDPNSGLGVYDRDKWAIVFRYSSVNIPADVTVTFINHPANPPVVWLVDGPVTIDGIVDVKSGDFDGLNFSIPGPGGFRGAGTNSSMGGLGPGGGDAGGSVASFGTGPKTYGNSRCLPLIGGSGGGGYVAPGWPSLAGAGAILIAATDTISIAGGIDASVDCCSGRATGGAIRLVCNRLDGNGWLLAAAADGNDGRIRIEANEVAFGDVGDPVASFGLPGSTAQVWPDDVVAPSVEVLEIGATAIPIDPLASFEFPYADVNLLSGVSQTLVIEARNIPTGFDPPGVDAWNVVARIVPRAGGDFSVNASYVSGDYALSIWEAVIELPDGFSAIQVRASMPNP